MITMIEGFVVSKIKLGETIGTQNQKMFSGTLKLINLQEAVQNVLDMTGFSLILDLNA